LHVADNETKSSDDAEQQQPSLSASALLRKHEETMKAKKRSTSSTTEKDDSLCSVMDNSQSSSSSVVQSGLVESVTETRDGLSVEQDPSLRLKPKHRVPELGRGLNASFGGFVDLDDIACSSVSATVTSDTAKVCVSVGHSLLIVILFNCYKFMEMFIHHIGRQMNIEHRTQYKRQA